MNGVADQANREGANQSAAQRKVATGFSGKSRSDFIKIRRHFMILDRIDPSWFPNGMQGRCSALKWQPYGPMKISREPVLNLIRAKLHVPLRF